MVFVEGSRSYFPLRNLYSVIVAYGTVEWYIERIISEEERISRVHCSIHFQTYFDRGDVDEFR